MSDLAKQEDFWGGDFGKEYTSRNLYTAEQLDEFYAKTWGVSRSALNQEFLQALPRDIKILEVGCNVGQQLRHLQLLGFENLYGIEIQREAVEMAKASTKNINIVAGSALDIPFRDGWFDLVFTSGVLIHIHPNDLLRAANEVCRCTNAYIWGFEYYSVDPQEVIYRGHEGLLWKRDFCRLYMSQWPNLKLIKERRVKYVANDNVDQMFLLKK